MASGPSYLISQSVRSISSSLVNGVFVTSQRPILHNCEPLFLSLILRLSLISSHPFTSALICPSLDFTFFVFDSVVLVFDLRCEIILLNGLPVRRHVFPSHLLINSFVKFCNYNHLSLRSCKFLLSSLCCSAPNDFCPFVRSPGLHGSFTGYTFSLE